jgi:hypothetical protein
MMQIIRVILMKHLLFTHNNVNKPGESSRMVAKPRDGRVSNCFNSRQG